jgi:hypothetical protein
MEAGHDLEDIFAAIALSLTISAVIMEAVVFHLLLLLLLSALAPRRRADAGCPLSLVTLALARSLLGGLLCADRRARRFRLFHLRFLLRGAVGTQVLQLCLGLRKVHVLSVGIQIAVCTTHVALLEVCL